MPWLLDCLRERERPMSPMVCSNCGRDVAGNYGDGSWRHVDRWTSKCAGNAIVPSERPMTSDLSPVPLRVDPLLMTGVGGGGRGRRPHRKALLDVVEALVNSNCWQISVDGVRCKHCAATAIVNGDAIDHAGSHTPSCYYRQAVLLMDENVSVR